MYATLIRQALRFDGDSLSSLSDQARGAGLNSSLDREDSSSVVSAPNELAQLFERYGRDDDAMQEALNNELNMCLFESIKLFLLGTFNAPHRKLLNMRKATERYSSRVTAPHMFFALNRMQALGYYLEGQLKLCVSHSNECIAHCPRLNGSHAPGLADTLLLLSEVYDKLGCPDEALHSARLCVDVALSRLETFERDVPREMLGIGLQHIPRCLGPALDEYTAMAAAYHNLAKRLASRGMDALAVEWNERALNTATKFGLDQLYIQELTEDLMESREAAIQTGKTQGGALAEVVVSGAFLNGDAASQLSMSPTSHFAPSPVPNNRSMPSEEAFQFAPGAFYDSIGSLEEDDVAAVPESRWLPADHRASEKPRERARPKSAIPNPTPNRRLPISSEQSLNACEDEIVQAFEVPLGRKNMQVHTAILDADEIGAPPSTRSRPKSAVSKLGGGYTPTGGSNDPFSAVASFDRAYTRHEATSDNSYVSETRRAFFSDDNKNADKVGTGDSSAIVRARNPAEFVSNFAHAGAKIAQEEPVTGRGGIVALLGNNSSKTNKKSRILNDKRAVVTNIHSAKQDIEIVQLFSVEATRDRPHVPEPPATHSNLRHEVAKPTAPLSNLLMTRSDTLTAQNLLDLADLHEREDVEQSIMRGDRKDSTKLITTSKGANYRLQTGPIFQETVRASNERVADSKDRTHKRTELAKKKSLHQLAQERKELEIDRMRLAAERERQQEAIEIERRRLDAARMELARLHETRMSALLSERDAAQREVQALAQALQTERDASREILQRERARGDKSLKKERMKLEFELAERLRSEIDTLRRADESRAALFLKQQEELASLLKPFHVGMQVEVEVEIDNRIMTNLGADRTNIWRLAFVTDILPGLLFNVRYIDGLTEIDTEENITFSRLRRLPYMPSVNPPKKDQSYESPQTIFQVADADPVPEKVATENFETRTPVNAVLESKEQEKAETMSTTQQKEIDIKASRQSEISGQRFTTREDLNQRRLQITANVLSDASTSADSRFKHRLTIRARAATVLQRIARGISVRSDVKLRSHLNRARILRKREQSLRAAQQELDKKAAETQLLLATNSLLQRQHEELMKSLHDMHLVEVRAAAASKQVDEWVQAAMTSKSKIASDSVQQSFSISLQNILPSTESRVMTSHVERIAQPEICPGDKAENDDDADALDAFVDLGDSHDHLSVFTSQSAESLIIQKVDSNDQNIALQESRQRTGGQRAPSPPRPFSRNSSKPRIPRGPEETYVPSDAVHQQLALIDSLEEGLEESMRLEELSAAYVRLSNLHYHDGAVKEAIDARERALLVYPQASAEVKVGILNFLIRMASDVSDIVAVEGYFRRAMETKYLLSTIISSEMRDAKSIVDHAKAPKIVYRPSARVLSSEAAIEQMQNTQSSDTPAQLIELYINLACDYFCDGATAEAALTFEKALKALHTYGASKAPVRLSVSILGSLGVLARLAGNLESAQFYFGEMIGVGQYIAQIASQDQTALVLDDNKTITDFSLFTVHYADLLRMQGNFTKATALLEDACDVLDANLGIQHLSSQTAHRCLLLAGQGVGHSISSFTAVLPESMRMPNFLRREIKDVPAVDIKDPTYAHKSAILQQVFHVLTTHPAKLNSFPDIIDLNALRAKCCHLLDPMCAMAVTTFTDDVQLQTALYFCKIDGPTLSPAANVIGCTKNSILPIINGIAPVVGCGPVDAEWPVISLPAKKEDFGVQSFDDHSSVASLDALSNGSTLFRSMLDGDFQADNAARDSVSPVTNVAEDGKNFAGHRETFSLPIFTLNKASWLRKNEKLLENEDPPNTEINIDITLRDESDTAYMPTSEKSTNTRQYLGWNITLSERTLMRMSKSGEWINFRLMNNPEPPRLLWLRASHLLLGNILDRFTQLWALHMQWVAHHILATAALEELVATSVEQGVELTRKSPGGGLHTLELFGYQARPVRGLLPSAPSGSATVRHITHGTVSDLNALSSDSHGNSQSAVETDWFGESTENEMSSRRKLIVEQKELTSRVGELENLLDTSRHTYAAFQADVLRSRAAFRKCLRQWELDSRRQSSMLRPVSDEKMLPSQPRHFAESVAVQRMSEISKSIYQLFSESTIGIKEAPLAKYEKRIIIGVSSWEEIRSALWNRAGRALMACLESLCESAGLRIGPDAFTSTGNGSESPLLSMRNIAHTACEVGIYEAASKIMTFPWNTWRSNAQTWKEAVDPTDLNAIVDQCELLMYAPVPQKILQHISEESKIFPKLQDSKGKSSAKLKVETLPHIQLFTDSQVLHLIQKAIQNRVQAVNSPRSNLQLRAQGAAESCAQQ